MLVFLSGWKRLPKRNIQKHTIPSAISIIVPVRNEQYNIINLLHSLKVQDYNRDFYEIIIVDDHSTDSTEQIAQKFKHQNLSLNVKIIKLSANETTKKVALRKGMEHAGGDIIIMTDADCRAGMRYLSTVNEYYRKQLPRLMIAPVKMKVNKNIFSQFQALEFHSLIFTAGGSSVTTGALLANGANLIVDRQIFNEKGNEDMFIRKHASGDDMFLLNFVKQTYGSEAVQFIKHKDAIMVTRTAQSLPDFMEQRKRWVSKSKSYTDIWLIITALIVLLTALAQLGSLVLGIVVPDFLLLAAIIWGGKFFVDFIILRDIANFFDQKKLLWWFLPASIIYPFYVVISVLTGLFTGYSWKGRIYSRGQ
ncbi:MAG: glycosyltransferase [Bacteroidales bacterium]